MPAHSGVMDLPAMATRPSPSPLLPLAGPWCLEALLEHLIDGPDFTWLMIDTSYGKVNRILCRSNGGQDAIR